MISAVIILWAVMFVLWAVLGVAQDERAFQRQRRKMHLDDLERWFDRNYGA